MVGGILSEAKDLIRPFGLAASGRQKRKGLRVTEKGPQGDRKEGPFAKLRASALERQKWRDPSFCAKLERKKEFFEQLRLFLTKLTLKIKI